MYTFSPGRSIIISPGRRPRGSFEIHGHKIPAAIIIIPAIIRVFCINPYIL
jgi:hypothetical protein